MLLKQKIEVKWVSRNKEHFKKLGYKFTQYFDKFEVDVNHLPENSNIKVKVKCDFCGIVIDKIYGNYLKAIKKGKDTCVSCINFKAAVRKGNTLGEKRPDLIKEWSPKNDKTPFDYSFSSNQKVWWICENKHEWYISPNKRDYTNCPHCTESKGERKIRKILDKYNVSYSQQYSFKNLLSENNYPLKFDFAVFENNKLLCLIEFDGIQHYEPTFGEETFKTTIYRDELKNKYCDNNNIKLIRIGHAYYDNIEDIILKKIRA